MVWLIDTPTAVANLPIYEEAGPEGYPTDGDPISGQAPTIVPASWVGMTQGEIAAFADAAGVPHVKGVYNQALIGAMMLFGTSVRDTGVANAYQIAPNPAVPAPIDGQPFLFRTTHPNTLASTLQVGTHAAVQILRHDGLALRPGDIITGWNHVVYDVAATAYLVTRPGRTKLVADLNLYVSPAGLDTNAGLTAGTAFATLQAAYAALSTSYDLDGRNAIINLAAGTYAGLTAGAPLTGGESVTIMGNTGAPSSVIIAAAGGACFHASAAAQITVQGVKLTNTGGDGFHADSSGIISFSAVEFGVCTGEHVSVISGGSVYGIGNYAITGGAADHYKTSLAGQIMMTGITVNLTGNPAFSHSFATANTAGVIGAEGMTFTGAATGVRYDAINNGVIDTNGAPTTYFPGSVAGSTGSGGLYV